MKYPTAPICPEPAIPHQIQSTSQTDQEEMKGFNTYTLLSELAGTLVLGVPQQLNDAALIGGETDDLAGDVADELSAAGRLALGTADLGLGGVEGSGFL